VFGPSVEYPTVEIRSISCHLGETHLRGSTNTTGRTFMGQVGYICSVRLWCKTCTYARTVVVRAVVTSVCLVRTMSL
jgi:hypothetical protein